MQTCLTLAHLYDTEDLTPLPHYHENMSEKEKKTTRKRAKAPTPIPLKTQIARKATALLDLALDSPLTEYDIKYGYSREYLISDITKQLSKMGEKLFKESFKTKNP